MQKKKQLIDPNLPRNVDIIPKTQKASNESENKTFTFRSFFKFPEFTNEIRQTHKETLSKYEQWKTAMKKQANEYGVLKPDD